MRPLHAIIWKRNDEGVEGACHQGRAADPLDSEVVLWLEPVHVPSQGDGLEQHEAEEAAKW